jgi:hypothetical protein
MGNMAELVATVSVALLIVLLSARTIGYRGEQCNGGESVSQPPLKDQAFSTFLDQNLPLELRPENGVSPQCCARKSSRYGRNAVHNWTRTSSPSTPPRRPCSSDPLFIPAAEELELNPAQVELSCGSECLSRHRFCWQLSRSGRRGRLIERLLSPEGHFSNFWSSTAINFVSLEIAAGSAQNRRTYTSPRCAFYHIANRVLAFRGPALFHVDQHRRPISRVRLRKHSAHEASRVRSRRRRRRVTCRGHHSRAFLYYGSDKGWSGS